MYGMFTYIYHTDQVNVGKYPSPMDPMGNKLLFFFPGVRLEESPKKHGE